MGPMADQVRQVFRFLQRLLRGAAFSAFRENRLLHSRAHRLGTSGNRNVDCQRAAQVRRAAYVLPSHQQPQLRESRRPRGIPRREVPPENETSSSPENYASSALYNAITELNPDVLIVTMHWFMVSSFIRDLPCKKIFLCRQVDERFFTIPLGEQALCFQPQDYNLTLAIEPFQTSLPLRRINPIVIRNRDEILPRKEALKKLGLDEGGNHCLFALNGKPGEFEETKKMYSYLENEGYQLCTRPTTRVGSSPLWIISTLSRWSSAGPELALSGKRFIFRKKPYSFLSSAVSRTRPGVSRNARTMCSQEMALMSLSS